MRRFRGRGTEFLWRKKAFTNLISIKKTDLLSPEIKNRIENALRHAANVHAERIEVEIATGKVILRGIVSSSSERITAERAARLVPGIVEVATM